MYAFGADLREDLAVRLFHEDCIEAVGSPDQEGTRAHRTRYAGWDFRPSFCVARQSGIGRGHAVERQQEDHDAAAIDRTRNLLARDAGPGSDGPETRILDRVTELLVVLRGPRRETGPGEHRRVLPRAVVMQSSRGEASVAKNFRATTCHRLM